jgi:predicted Zn finger-like uncharacterized protein
MPEITRCPNCERQVRVPDELLGKLVKCPTCGTTFTASAVGDRPAAPPEPRPAPPPAGAYREEPPQPRRAVLRSDNEDYEEHYGDDEEYDEDRPRRRGRRGRRALEALRAPAICLLVTGVLGLLFSIYMLFGFALTDPADVNRQVEAQQRMQGRQVNPQQTEMAKRVAQMVVGPVGMAFCLVFIVLNLVVILGGIMMLVGKMRWLGYLASVLSLLNISCCCVCSLPFGIWALVVLSRAETASAFT